MAREGARNEASQGWTSTQAYVMASICLVVGVALGYLFRGSESNAMAASQAAQTASAQSATSGTQQQMPSLEDLKRMADTQAAPLIEQLQSDPNNPSLLATIGN